MSYKEKGTTIFSKLWKIRLNCVVRTVRTADLSWEFDFWSFQYKGLILSISIHEKEKFIKLRRERENSSM